MGGVAFKRELPVDKYLLLPSMWQGMLPEKKQEAVNMYKIHDSWNVECIMDIKDTINIAIKDMQSLRVCIESAIENPDHIKRVGLTNSDGNQVDCNDLEIFNEVDNKKFSPNKDLVNFQLKPSYLKGQALFEHMIKYRELHSEDIKKKENCKTTTSPSDYFDVTIRNNNRQILKFQRDVLCGKNIGTKRQIIEDTSGRNATLRIAKQKNDFIGNIKSHSCLLNNKENLSKLKKI